MTQTTLANVLQERSLEAQGYDDIFNRLMDTVRDRRIDDSMGKDIQKLILDYLAENPPREFDRYSDKSYLRTYIGRDDATGWEAIMMSWREGNVTSIHAHPQFAGYHFADGRFRLEIFEPTADGKARRIKDVTITAPCAFYAIGDEGSFENHIHRITCLSPTGHSLHVYSDDASPRQGIRGGDIESHHTPPPSLNTRNSARNQAQPSFFAQSRVYYV